MLTITDYTALDKIIYVWKPRIRRVSMIISRLRIYSLEVQMGQTVVLASVLSGMMSWSEI